MKLHHPARTQHGLTLIELMVALAVFAVLGLLAWRGIERMVDGSQRVEAELARWQQIGRAVARIESDLMQLVVPSAGLETVAQGSSGDPPALWLYQSDEMERASEPVTAQPTQQASQPFGKDSTLSLLVMVSDGAGLRRIVYRHQQGRLYWLRWPGRSGPDADTLALLARPPGDGQPPALLAPPADAPQQADLLLDGVRALRWRFIASQTRHPVWPPAGINRATLPAAVEFELELDGVPGVVRRIVALR